MPTYAIGDIQGCYEALTRLLDSFAFDASRDTLWLVGDLVNRGPSSLEVLRWAKNLGDRCVMVLGNHETYLIARALGVMEPRRNDTLSEVLAAPDKIELIEWLRTRPQDESRRCAVGERLGTFGDWKGSHRFAGCA